MHQNQSPLFSGFCAPAMEESLMKEKLKRKEPGLKDKRIIRKNSRQKAIPDAIIEADSWRGRSGWIEEDLVELDSMRKKPVRWPKLEEEIERIIIIIEFNLESNGTINAADDVQMRENYSSRYDGLQEGSWKAEGNFEKLSK